jgi:catechol 2,3-dioxygenase-like lactoylglutathione lyase family enzyme
MSSVQIEQKSYEMPPREGISIAQFLTVADIERSAHYYEKVFGARILSLGDGRVAHPCPQSFLSFPISERGCRVPHPCAAFCARVGFHNL